ncbi:MAG: protein kinase [Sphingomicrobium sp.]
MRPQGRLEIATGFASLCGRRPDNQDYCGVYFGSAREQARAGMVAALADGVGGAKGGREAAELAVRSFIDGYYAQPETIGTAAAARRSLAGFNRWLHRVARRDPTLEGAACTFTALILRGRRASVAHVGDSRAWHFREGQLSQLTEDHVLPHPDQRHILYRAVGIEPDLRLDCSERDLAVHDRLLLTSDGVHGTLGARTIAKLLGERNSAEADALAIAEAAAAAGSQDNITALVVDVVAVPAVDVDALADLASGLPLLEPPKAGEAIDGFRLKTMLSDGRYTRIFHAVDESNGGDLVLKFPKPSLLSEEGARLAFTRESLVGARVDNPYVASATQLPPERQTRLYVAMPLYRGETLEARIVRSTLSTRRGIQVGARLARAVAALHRLEIVHRDIKPDNVILTEDGGQKLIDLGVARLPRVPEFATPEIPGTPSYMAPELFAGRPGDALTDQYAIGVTLYRLFTGRYPYGEVEPFSRPKFGTAAPPSRYRADIPGWLDAAILRAVAVQREDRFGDVVELQIALESGADRATGSPARQPLAERNPVLFWKCISGLLAIALAVALLTR